MISLSALTVVQSPKGTGSSPPPPSGNVSVTAFTADRVIFDSGAALGQAQADIALSGTGTTGEIIQARAVSLDDGGATTTAWADVGAVGALGDWAGIITVPRGPSWYRPQVRLKAFPGIAALGAMRFGVGHVIAIWGQSEPDRILSAFYDNTTAPPVSDPEAVQIFHGVSTTPTRHIVTDAQPLTAAVAAMANTLIAARPGEKFALIFQTVPGTDPRALVNDGNASRSWAADKALHDFATGDGQHVGIAAMSWFAAPGSLGAAYGEALFPLFSGKLINGTSVSFPATITYGGNSSYQADHWFGELYDYAQTRWVPYGPHRFDITADMQDATHFAGGGQDFNLVNKELVRKSWRAMLSLPDATMFQPLGLEPTTYVNGFDNALGGWTDIPHPAGNTPDGTQAFARLTAEAILQSAGLTTWSPPEFDQCLWEPSGAWVEVWSSAGAVTTTRLARGDVALGTTHPHWTEVLGFQINGLPANTTQIVAGRVRIFPNGGAFTASDTIQYGEGGATGMIDYPDDHIAGVWKNLPIVDLGLAGLDGVPVRPLANPLVLANTLPAGAMSFTTSSGGPYFLNPVNVPAGISAITFAAKVRFAALPGSTAILFAQSSTGFDVELMNNGSLRVTLEDGSGAKMLSSHIVATALGTGNWYELVVSADQAAQVLRVVVNNALVAAVPFTGTSNGVFQSNRALSFLGRNNGSLQFAGEIEHLRAWHSATATGDAPQAPPFKEILGPAAVANADGWKLGANAV
ncbi:MAG: LamG-like jellyroll fold domain-containing protein [Albidovulum sp.]